MTDYDEIVSLFLNAAATIPGSGDVSYNAGLYAKRLCGLLARRTGLVMQDDGMFTIPRLLAAEAAEKMLNRRDVSLSYQLATGGYIEATMDDEPHWLVSGYNESGQLIFNLEFYSLVEMWKVIEAGIEEDIREADSTGS